MAPKPRKSAPAGQPGVRERSKQATLARIVKAARKLFAEEGYDRATLRRMAARAGVGLGTLSNYVTVKRDLIYLIFNEEMDALTAQALAAPQPSQTFVEKILSITEHHFRMFAAEPALSRILLSEILQESPGVHYERYLRGRERLIYGVEDLVIAAQQTGEIGSEEVSDLIALDIFFTISASARWFLATPKPDWRDGLHTCERILTMRMAGLAQPPKARRNRTLLARRPTLKLPL